MRETDHRGRLHVQRAAEGTGAMKGVRRVVGGGIPDESSDNSTWEGGKDMTAMEHPGRRVWALDFHNYVPREWKPVELPGGGMPRPSGYEDGNAGALPAPAFP